MEQSWQTLFASLQLKLEVAKNKRNTDEISARSRKCDGSSDNICSYSDIITADDPTTRPGSSSYGSSDYLFSNSRMPERSGIEPQTTDGTLNQQCQSYDARTPKKVVKSEPKEGKKWWKSYCSSCIPSKWRFNSSLIITAVKFQLYICTYFFVFSFHSLRVLLIKFFSCPHFSLKEINFSRKLPDIEHSMLIVLNVSYNRFSGTSSALLHKGSSYPFLGMGICDGPLPSCLVNISSTLTGVRRASRKKSKISKGVIIVIISAVISVASAIILYCHRLRWGVENSHGGDGDGAEWNLPSPPPSPEMDVAPQHGKNVAEDVRNTVSQPQQNNAPYGD